MMPKCIVGCLGDRLQASVPVLQTATTHFCHFTSPRYYEFSSSQPFDTIDDRVFSCSLQGNIAPHGLLWPTELRCFSREVRVRGPNG